MSPELYILQLHSRTTWCWHDRTRPLITSLSEHTFTLSLSSNCSCSSEHCVFASRPASSTCRRLAGSECSVLGNSVSEVERRAFDADLRQSPSRRGLAVGRCMSRARSANSGLQVSTSRRKLSDCHAHIRHLPHVHTRTTSSG